MVNNEANETKILSPEPGAHIGLGYAAIIGKETLQGPTQEQLKLLSASVGLASAITEQYPQTGMSKDS